MQCFLHVGTEKTATTTLQHIFDRNRQRLLDQGLAYTRSAGETNNWRLAVAAYDDDRCDDRSVDAGVGDARSREAFREWLMAQLLDELDAATEAGARSVLFSSEHLHSRLTRPSELKRLARLLDSLGISRTTVIVYLRDPVAVAASLHSTRVKHGATTPHPPPPQSPYFHNVCHHRQTIERWGSVFDRVVPRLFEADALVGGSVIADMLHVLGVDVDDALNDPDGNGDRRNRSLSRAEIEVLSRINEHLPYSSGGVLNPLHARLVQAMERHSEGPPFQLPPHLAEQYRMAFADSNEWVRARYFPGRPHLFGPQNPDHQDTPNPAGFDGLASLILDLASTALTPPDT